MQITVFNVETQKAEQVQTSHEPEGAVIVYGPFQKCIKYLAKVRAERMELGYNSDTQKVLSITFRANDYAIVGFGTL